MSLPGLDLPPISLSGGVDSDEKQVRILICFVCKSMETLPDYSGAPENDVLLDELASRHVQKHGDDRSGALFRCPESKWDHPATRRDIVKRMWAGTTGFKPSYYDAKDTFVEDAGRCYNQHKRPAISGGSLCHDYRNESKRLGSPTTQDRKAVEKEFHVDLGQATTQMYLCQFCLTGDTEVVTRDGIMPISQLAGKSPELLVPFQTGGTLTIGAQGSFKQAEVHYFGEQVVYAIRLRRGKTTRVVEATAEHRWFVRTRRQGSIEERTTAQLRPGDVLQPLKAVTPRGKELEVPFGTAQGFVFGDGSHGHHDHRPASLPLYGAKDMAVEPYFVACNRKYATINGKRTLVITGLPRHWKRPPPLDESRSFLLSWLAGYFAADGFVSDVGQTILSSANREHLEFARSVAAVCGVGTTAITMKMRRGTGDHDTPLYGLPLAPRDLPDWFWIIDSHRERIEQLHRTTPRERAWKVESVEDAQDAQPVYCAVNVGAFALADDLMTGNCPYEGEVRRMKQG